MALDDLLASARTKLPLLRQVEGTGAALSPFTTQRQEAPQPQVAQPITPPPASPSLTSLPVPSLQANPLEGLQNQTQADLIGLAAAPQPQVEPSIPLMQAALGPILGKGQGGTGSAQGDIDRGIDIVAHGISSGTTSIPSGGPTSNVNYADLPGKYGPLIDPPGGPSDLRLQKGAWQSLHRLGVPAGAILPGSYRTNAQQIALYAKDPNRFASPGHSLHEYGLAIDVTSSMVDKYAQTLLNNGWYRERSDEPWHFSFGVFTPAPTPKTTKTTTKTPTRTPTPKPSGGREATAARSRQR